MKFILEALLQVGIIIPFAILLMKDKKLKDNYLKILLFAAIYVLYYFVLILPGLSNVFNFIKGSWNWDGKILGIIFGIVCYFVFRNSFSENDFFTLKQNKAYFKKTFVWALLIVLVSTIVWYVFGKSEFDIETLAFQLSIPGIDEEIMFRGILLGLLVTVLKEKIVFIGNPGVLLTAILFGFMHALKLNENYSIRFEPIYFIQTGFAGYVWGWITLKSRSILFAILSHNFSNFFGTLSTMIK